MSDGIIRNHGFSYINGITTPYHENCAECNFWAEETLAQTDNQVKLTEREIAAIALVAAKTEIHDDVVERFYRHRNDDYILPKNRIIGLFVEVVATLKAEVGK